MVDPARLGPFVLERELGRGGMGVVYAARRDDDVPVALKVSLGDLPDRDKKHFLEEAELLARVSHPAVIRILESGAFEDGRPYLVMPLLEGETLAARLERGRIDPDRALRLFAQLAGAVATLHDAGIVHRDIKPENVMLLAGEEKVVLLDFGIARDTDRPASTTTRMNLVRGTPGCMAPERFFGVRASTASDVYELAVVLYAMLVGRLPWDEPTDPESRLRPRHPAELGVALPVGLGHAMLEALSTRPERRPTARGLAARVRTIEGTPRSPVLESDTALLPPDALHPTELVLAGQSPPPRARSVAPPSEPADRRGAALWIAGALVMTALAVGASVRARSTHRGPPPYARVGLGVRAAEASLRASALRIEPTPSPSPAGAAPVDTGPADAPGAAAPPPAAATASPASQAPALPWCTKLIDLYCTPAARALPGGDARCAARRADLAHMASLPPSTRARSEDQCRDAIPALEQSIRTPQPSEAPADLPWCKRVVAVYCSPEVKNTMGGEAMCGQAQARWGARMMSLPPATRAAEDEGCARLLPAVTQAMRQHVRDMGPGTAGSARWAASQAPAPAAPGASRP